MEKLELAEYSKNFPSYFGKIKGKIQDALGNIDIHHVGSTAVEGLSGKGIIDILIGVKTWKNIDEIIRGLKKIGFIHIHPKENGRIFLSTNKISKLGDFHIHIVVKNTKQYQEIIGFRNLLRHDEKIRNDYQKIKANLIKTSSSRKTYEREKGHYITKILATTFQHS